MSNDSGRLYVVATPIGHREDVTERARRLLGEVDLVAAEDTRHTGRLLAHWGLATPLLSLHEHNETARVEAVARRIAAGETVALVSDAGTPLISDPGYPLVRELLRRGLRVDAVPGPSSITAALSVSGLPTDRFVYEGFLPARGPARRRRLAAIAPESRTLVLLESSHRIVASIQDLADAFGPDREATICRELTKAFETVRLDTLSELSRWVAADPDQQRGEFVMVVAGAPEGVADSDPETDRILDVLTGELSTKQAARLAASITGAPRNALYRRLLDRRGGDD